MMLGANFGRDVWKKSLGAAELGHVRVHDLRHTCASLMIQVGAHPKAIQLHLGHASIEVTMNLYGHLFPDHMEAEAAKVDEAYAGIHATHSQGLRPVLSGRTLTSGVPSAAQMWTRNASQARETKTSEKASRL